MQERDVVTAGAHLESLRNGVLLLALRALGDLEAAEEVAQETLVRALDAIEAVVPEKLGAYVAGIARHVIADVGRARKRVVSLDPLQAELVAAAGPDALESLCAASELARVSQALEALTPDDRELLRLSFFEGLSPTEIAERLGAPSDRIRQRKLRALVRLRRAFVAIEAGSHADAHRTTTIDGRDLAAHQRARRS